MKFHARLPDEGVGQILKQCGRPATARRHFAKAKRLAAGHLAAMYAPLITKLTSDDGADSARAFEQPTGWPAVDRGLEDVLALVRSAADERHFQTVGLNCRELTITLAQIVFDPSRHTTVDGVAPSPTDAKRMLEAYIAKELQGESNEGLRKYARSAFDLANNLQHRRTATFRDAALCAEATASLVNLIAIVSGRRDDVVPVFRDG